MKATIQFLYSGLTNLLPQEFYATWLCFLAVLFFLVIVKAVIRRGR